MVESSSDRRFTTKLFLLNSMLNRSGVSIRGIEWCLIYLTRMLLLRIVLLLLVLQGVVLLVVLLLLVLLVLWR